MGVSTFRTTLIVVAAVAFTILGTVPAADAQHTGRVYRVGYISLGSPARLGMWSNLLEALRELNYVEGQNLLVKLAIAEGKPERLPSLAADLVRAKMDDASTFARAPCRSADRVGHER